MKVLHVQIYLHSGTLAPPLPDLRKWSSNSVDLLFGTHWVPPVEVPVVSEENEACIAGKLRQAGYPVVAASKASSPAFTPTPWEGLEVADDDFDTAFLSCLREERSQKAVDEFLEAVPKSPGYDAFQVQMGQLTIYRWVEELPLSYK